MSQETGYNMLAVTALASQPFIYFYKLLTQNTPADQKCPWFEFALEGNLLEATSTRVHPVLLKMNSSGIRKETQSARTGAGIPTLNAVVT